MTQTFPCIACGAPNEPAAGRSRMACAYCGANLTIPESLRVKAKPTAAVKPLKVEPSPSFEDEAADILRKAQPIAVKAWNTYAYWTWIRRLLPTCLVITFVSFLICIALGTLPFLFNWFR